MSANEEALVHLNRGLELLKTLPDTLERAERELALQLAVAVPIIATKSWGATEANQAYARALELCQEIGDTSQLLLAMVGEYNFRLVRAEHRAALELAKQVHALSQRSEDPVQVMLGHQGLAGAFMFVGDFKSSLTHAEQLMTRYDPQLHRSLAYLWGQDPAVVSLSWAIYDLWFLGYPDQAMESSQEAIALAKELDHPFTLFFASEFTARLHRWRGEVQAVQELAKAILRLWSEHGFPLAEAAGTMHKAWALFECGRHEQGIAQFGLGLAGLQATGFAGHLTEFLGVLAEMRGVAGQPESGLSTLDEALDITHNSDERYYEAELYRLRGELLLMLDVRDEPGAEATLCQAIQVARRQSAKMCELRATVSLCHLWLAQERGDKRKEAREMLTEVYDWFTEGFDTRDLEEARALLETLA